MESLIASILALPEHCLLGHCGTTTDANVNSATPNVSPHIQPCEQASKEQALFAAFLPKLKNSVSTEVNQDTGSTTLSTTDLVKLFNLVVEKRLQVVGFMQGLRHTHVHLVLSFVRLALKNGAVVEKCRLLLDEEFVAYITRLGDIYCDLYTDSAFHSQKVFDILLIEVITILSRITCNHSLNPILVSSHDNLSSVMALCSSVMMPNNKSNLLQCSLQLVLDCLSANDSKLAAVHKQIVNCNAFNIVGQVVDILYHLTSTAYFSSDAEYVSNLTNSKMAAEIISMLCEVPMSEEKNELVKLFLELDLVPVLVNNIRLDSFSSIDLCLTCCWIFAKLCSFSPEIIHCSVVKRDSNSLGGQIVPHLLGFLMMTSHSINSCENDLESEATAGKHFSCMLAVCSAFSRICRLSEFNEKVFVESNGIYVMGHIVFSIPFQKTKIPGCKQEMLNVVASALMVLRLLFSSKEKNRSLIRTFIPPELCEQFANCGNYNLNICSYYKLASDVFNKVVQQSLKEEEILKKLSGIDMQRETVCDPKTIGKYCVIDTLGNGSFGSVFKVTKKQDSMGGRDVSDSRSYYALKKITFAGKEPASKKKTMAATIVNEIKILKEKLSHPNLVRYLKSFHENETLYVLMELVEGVSLQEHLDYIETSQSGPIEEGRVWNIAIQFIQGLKYLHVDKGLIHRDLSPNNILLTFEDVVKITDFGFTRATNNNGVCTSVVGTVSYWCPEITQEKEYDHKADIWAYGCILYQICTLRPPFIAANILSIAKKIVECNYPPMDQALPYSLLLRQLISKCITADKDCRPDALGVVHLLSPKLLEQIDSQSEKLKQSKRKADALKQCLVSATVARTSQNRPKCNTLEVSIGSHGDLQSTHSTSAGLSPSPASECHSANLTLGDQLSNSMSSTFPPASHSRASSATSLNSVPEESQSSTTNTLHAYIQTQRLNSPVYGNNLYTAQGALGLSQTVKSSSTRAAMTGVNNRMPTITLPRSKLRELKVVHGTENNGGKTNSELAKVNGSGDGIVDVLQFLRRLDELCNRKSCGLPNLVCRQLYLVSVVRKRLYTCEDSSWMQCETQKFLERSQDLLHPNYFLPFSVSGENFQQNWSSLAVNCLDLKHSNSLPRNPRSIESIAYLDFMNIVNSL